jgi:hypothetical protein
MAPPDPVDDAPCTSNGAHSRIEWRSFRLLWRLLATKDPHSCPPVAAPFGFEWRFACFEGRFLCFEWRFQRFRRRPFWLPWRPSCSYRRHHGFESRTSRFQRSLPLLQEAPFGNAKGVFFGSPKRPLGSKAGPMASNGASQTPQGVVLAPKERRIPVRRRHLRLRSRSAHSKGQPPSRQVALSGFLDGASDRARRPGSRSVARASASGDRPGNAGSWPRAPAFGKWEG